MRSMPAAWLFGEVASTSPRGKPKKPPGFWPKRRNRSLRALEQEEHSFDFRVYWPNDRDARNLNSRSKVETMSANKQRAFVIRPFGIKKDSAGGMVDFDHVHAELIGPALKGAGLVGSTTGEIIEAGNIREDMFSLIIEADLIVCDITHHNANVFYELGIRHALRRKRTVLIKGSPVADRPRSTS